MKRFLLSLSFFAAISVTAFAQGNVADTHPTASIFAIDYSTGQETQVNYDAAILFKNALIDLVSNTTIARMQVTRMVPGKKSFVVTQMDPQTNGNAYQLVMQNLFLGRTSVLYTFIYSVDQNALTYRDQQSGRYIAVPVQGANVNNLNNCATYGQFNIPKQAPAVAAAPPQAIGANNADTAPIDVDVSSNIEPPALPDYDQPECPVDGYLWQPGYWAFSRDTNGYYWVPGAWVAPPETGFLWTPPYWGFDNNVYVFHGGYWGSTIGFYGGLNYGYGYGGVGFVGGNWYNGRFRYNTAVLRVNSTVIRNVYVDRSVIVVRDGNRASFNGRGGVVARANDRELAAMRERHVMATPEQIRNQRAAREDRNQFASANGGRPANAASARAMEPRPNQGQNSRPGTNGGNMGGRPEMNNNAGNNNGQQNNAGRPNMNNNANTPATNNAAPQPANTGGQGMRPGANAAPTTNSAATAPTSSGQQNARPATGAPGANAPTPGANQNRPATAGGTPPSTTTAPGSRAATGAKPTMQRQVPQRQKTPPPEPKKVP